MKKTSEDDRKPERRRRFGWSGFSYSTRLTVSFAAIAALTALVSIGVLSFVWDQHFKSYTTDNMQEVATQLAAQVGDGYRRTGSWTSEETTAPAKYISASYNARVQIIRTDDPKLSLEEATVWDSNRVAFGTTTTIPQLKTPTDAQTKTASITVHSGTDDAQVVGYVRIWVYGSDTLSSRVDDQFRNASYEAMVFAAIFAVVLAMCIGFLFARNLVNPIHRIMRTAEAIKDGNMEARTNMQGDDEIARLGETFDEMSEAIEKDRLLERRLTTDVAHELRTPLMAIQSTVEAMVDGVFEADVERLETVNSEVQRLSRLVDALLRLSRLESRSTPMEEAIVNVGELIAGIVATHEAFVADSGLSLEFHTDRDVYVYGDADMIRQATANLISNAVRYTPEGGHISVRVKRGDIMASIAVQDTGIGLTPEEAKMVFSRFWRADAGRNREQGGLGVGLAVVKEIVDRHGGWVHVEGKPDQGATFTIYIPLYDEATVRAKMRDKRKNTSTDKTKRR